MRRSNNLVFVQNFLGTLGVSWLVRGMLFHIRSDRVVSSQLNYQHIVYSIFVKVDLYVDVF